MKDFSTVMALLVGGIIIMTYKFEFEELNSEEYRTDGGKVLLYSPKTFKLADDIIFGLGAVQAVTSFMLVVGFLVNKSALIIKSGWR